MRHGGACARDLGDQARQTWAFAISALDLLGNAVESNSPPYSYLSRTMSELNSMLSRVSMTPCNEMDRGSAQYVVSLEKSARGWVAVATDGGFSQVIGRASTALGLMVRVWVWTFGRKSRCAADA